MFTSLQISCTRFQPGYTYTAKKSPGQAPRRHPEFPPYRCFLSDLTGFAGFRRAGPTRTARSIISSPVRLSINETLRVFLNPKGLVEVYLVQLKVIEIEAGAESARQQPGSRSAAARTGALRPNRSARLAALRGFVSIPPVSGLWAG